MIPHVQFLYIHAQPPRQIRNIVRFSTVHTCRMEHAQLQDIADDKRARMEEAIRQLDRMDIAIEHLTVRLERSRRRRQAPPSVSCGLSRGEVLWSGSSAMTVLLEQRLGVLVAIRAAYRRFVVRTYYELAELEVFLSYDVFYGYVWALLQFFKATHAHSQGDHWER